MEHKLEKDNLKIGAIYPTSKLTKIGEAGTPVKLLEVGNFYKLTVQDYNGECWNIIGNEISKKPINKMPKTYLVCHLNIYSILRFIYNVIAVIVIWSNLLYQVKLLLGVVNDNQKAVLLFTLFVVCFLPYVIIKITNNYGSFCCFASKQNINKLKILLNKEETVRGNENDNT